MQNNMLFCRSTTIFGFRSFIAAVLFATRQPLLNDPDREDMYKEREGSTGLDYEDRKSALEVSRR